MIVSRKGRPLVVTNKSDSNDGNFIGAYTLKGEINMTTVRAAVESVVSTYIGKLRVMVDSLIGEAP